MNNEKNEEKEETEKLIESVEKLLEETREEKNELIEYDEKIKISFYESFIFLIFNILPVFFLSIFFFVSTNVHFYSIFSSLLVYIISLYIFVDFNEYIQIILIFNMNIYLWIYSSIFKLLQADFISWYFILFLNLIQLLLLGLYIHFKKIHLFVVTYSLIMVFPANDPLTLGEVESFKRLIMYYLLFYVEFLLVKYLTKNNTIDKTWIMMIGNPILRSVNLVVIVYFATFLSFRILWFKKNQNTMIESCSKYKIYLVNWILGKQVKSVAKNVININEMYNEEKNLDLDMSSDEDDDFTTVVNPKKLVVGDVKNNVPLSYSLDVLKDVNEINNNNSNKKQPNSKLKEVKSLSSYKPLFVSPLDIKKSSNTKKSVLSLFAPETSILPTTVDSTPKTVSLKSFFKNKN